MPKQETYFNQIKAGNRQAFELLFKLYYSSLCTYGYSFLKEWGAAEEIVQDVFLKIWERRRELEITTSEKSYLYSSVRNACLNQIKHIKIREDYKVHNNHEIKWSENHGTNPAVEMELREKIQNVIKQLPEQRQIIFRMSREEGLKYKEIAEKLGLSVKTVEAQMGKALKFMREELEEYLVVLIIFSIYMV